MEVSPRGRHDRQPFLFDAYEDDFTEKLKESKSQRKDDFLPHYQVKGIFLNPQRAKQEGKWMMVLAAIHSRQVFETLVPHVYS